MARLDLHLRSENISRKLLVGAALWVAVIVAGIGLLWRYETIPGHAAGPARRWPLASGLGTQTSVPKLLVFAHPKCPCTRATFAELSRIQARAGHDVEIHIVFVRPTGTPAGWERTELWRYAESIPGAVVHVDHGAREARRFGASTSGYSMLYGSDGDLRFAGGITAARGHAGDNPSEDALVSALRTGKTVQNRTPVFGCSLVGES